MADHKWLYFYFKENIIPAILIKVRILIDQDSFSGNITAISLQMSNTKNIRMDDIITDCNQSKPAHMPYVKLKQLQFEKDSWKRMLAFMMDENIRLKNRLSEVLKESFDIHLLDELESFQSKFIKEDELIGLMRNEAVELEKLLVQEIIEDENMMTKVIKKIKKLRNNIVTVETQLGKLKFDFNNYLLENM